MQTSNITTISSNAIQEIENLELSVVMPCLNEAETLEYCIKQILAVFKENAIQGEVIVADNGSTDGSIEIAQKTGAKIINVTQKGYGNALKGGINASSAKYIIMGDADASYNFQEIPVLLTKLREGYELVMGNRFLGGIKKGAMPFLHKYLGNPVLSFLGRLFYNIPINDFHCGLRGFSNDSFKSWSLKTTGMEFASEMVVKAALNKAKITEVPVTLSPDGRSRPPHLKTWQDGWRHLHFLLINSPRWLFIIPGITLFLIGLIFFLLVLPQPIQIGRFGLDVHTLLLSMAMIISGYQSVTIGIITRIYATIIGTKKSTELINVISKPKTINTLIFTGVAMVLLGIGGIFYSFYVWERTSFSTLNPTQMLRLILPFVLFFLMGFQTMITGFLTSIIKLKID